MQKPSIQNREDTSSALMEYSRSFHTQFRCVVDGKELVIKRQLLQEGMDEYRPPDERLRETADTVSIQFDGKEITLSHLGAQQLCGHLNRIVNENFIQKPTVR